ncbi:MAG: 2OG-Fe(II) oxygenase [Alphaproteobacteria bacterium]|nr:2OG-Fe(II) oxygenase [Alphaproteobacteria bacterium]
MAHTKLDPVDFGALARAEPKDEPFRHVIVPGFVFEAAQQGIEADYPQISHPGSFPLPSLTYGPRFATLMEALTGPQMQRLVSEKLDIDLTNRPVTATVRGISRSSDGEIHTDSKSKLVTLLLYMNQAWESSHGRLRLLRSPHNLDDYTAEVPPDRGTLLLFRNGPRAWHGFEAFEGPRRVIQINWVTSDAVVRREGARHRLSAFMKRLFAPEAV